MGRRIMRSFASSAGLGSSQEKFGCEGCGLERLFMRSRAPLCRVRGRVKAVAMEE